MHVFRDETNLSASPGLWTSIETALDDSEYFILLISLQSAVSKWVCKEVEYWVSSHSPETLVLVLTEGDIVWDAERSDFDWNLTTLPANLRTVYREEPNWVDLRWINHRESFSLHDPRFRDKVADISATLLKRDKDELVGEDVHQQLRARRLTILIILVLAVLTITSVTTAVWANRERERARARELTAYAAVSQTEDPAVSLFLGWQAAQVSRPLAPGLERVLDDALFTGNIATLRGHQEKVISVVWSPDGRSLASVSDDGTAKLWDGVRARRYVRSMSVSIRFIS
jgi:hypothetical protein